MQAVDHDLVSSAEGADGCGKTKSIDALQALWQMLREQGVLPDGEDDAYDPPWGTTPGPRDCIVRATVDAILKLPIMNVGTPAEGHPPDEDEDEDEDEHEHAHNNVYTTASTQAVQDKLARIVQSADFSSFIDSIDSTPGAVLGCSREEVEALLAEHLPELPASGWQPRS